MTDWTRRVVRHLDVLFPGATWDVLAEPETDAPPVCRGYSSAVTAHAALDGAGFSVARGPMRVMAARDTHDMGTCVRYGRRNDRVLLVRRL